MKPKGFFFYGKEEAGILITMTTPHPKSGHPLAATGKQVGLGHCPISISSSSSESKAEDWQDPGLRWSCLGELLLPHCRRLTPDSPPQNVAVLYSMKRPMADLWGFDGEEAKPGASTRATPGSCVYLFLVGLILYGP